jgi:glycosyltransferase involved in cell wall biosynthesis
VVQGERPLIGHAPVRLAFTLISRQLWAGGYNYQRNLFAALHRYRPSEFVPVIFAGSADDSDDLAGLSAIPGVEVVQANAFDQQTSGLAMALLLGLDRAAAAVFRNQNIDVVVETARFFGWRLPYPAVAWFPDFQHRRLPHLFSSAARWRREIGFRVQIASGRTIMLSSESALRDCEAFYPKVAGRASVVRFASLPSTELLSADPGEIIKQNNLPERFFFLPNQFWRHKNHQVVLDALAILTSRGIDVVIAASGSKVDPREPDYFDSIMRQIAERNLSRNFRYLGMIPLSHVYALLRVSAALINPSRFEGWSTTVEEAKSFGVPMILSDLDVHREQTAGMAMYFGTDDPASLADHLITVANQAEPCFVRDLVPDLDGRVSMFAADFSHTICGAIESRRSFRTEI